jgi:GT2 family glycosyltransferase
MGKRDIAIILPTYNQYEITKKNILLLKKQTIRPDIILVDNFSTDETSKKLKKEFKDIKIIRKNYNSGSSGGQNTGGRYAFKKKYKNIIFSDNDAYPISKDLIEKLVKKVNSDEKIGFVVPSNIFIKNKSNLNEEKIRSYAFHFLTTKREIVKKIGYPDEEYFLQIDDLDYTSRILSHGYEGIKLNEVYFSHPFKAISNLSPFFVYYTIRNTLYFTFKGVGGLRKIKEVFKLLSKSASIVAFSELTGNSDLKKAVNLAIKDYKTKKMRRNNIVPALKLEKFIEIEKLKESLEKPSQIYLSLWFNKNTVVRGEKVSYKFESVKYLRKIRYIFNFFKFQIKYMGLYFR